MLFRSGTRFIASTECSMPHEYKQAIVESGEEDIDWTVKLTGVPVSVIKTESHKRENNWIVRKLLSGRLKHRTRWLLNTLSFRRWRKMSKGKRVGMVFQQFNLFPHLSILENITLAPINVQKHRQIEAEEYGMYLLSQMGIDSHEIGRAHV